MPDIKDPENLKAVILIILPGFLFLWARSRLITGSLPAFSEATFVYFTITIAYWGLIWPVIPWILTQEDTWHWLGFKFLLFVYLIPLTAGTIAGGLTRLDGYSSFLRWLGVHPVHPAVTAWDRIFSKQQGHYVRILLTDGSFVVGTFGEKSYASRDVANRDIFLEASWQVDQNGVAVPGLPSPATYIPAAKIAQIFFYPTA